MQPQAIVEVMGGAAAIEAPVRDLVDLSGEIAKGLPLLALKRTLARISRDPAEQKRLLYRIVPEGSYKRRVKAGRLSPVESERVARLANIVALVEYVWDDPEAAHRFLITPHSELRDRAPVEVAVDEFGARRVEEILMGILHGLPA